MKRTTMELGGHAPAIVFDDADLDQAVNFIGLAKFRNAGQVCITPTRMLVQDNVYDAFVDRFVAYTRNVKVGDGLDETVTMGPLAHERRLAAVEGMVQDALQKGGRLRTGGQRLANKGYFFEPTVLTDVQSNAEAMQLEVFGPVALITPFRDFDEAVNEANRLRYGLAGYAYTRSAKTANDIAVSMQSGMVSINHNGLALPETPFGGVKDSGHGAEGGMEGIDAYVSTKFVSQLGVI